MKGDGILNLFLFYQSYLINSTISQTEEHRQHLIKNIPSFINELCNLESYPDQTISAMVYALQRFALSDLGKDRLVRNTYNVLTHLITMYHGKVRENENSIMLKYLLFMFFLTMIVLFLPFISFSHN